MGKMSLLRSYNGIGLFFYNDAAPTALHLPMLACHAEVKRRRGEGAGKGGEFL
jgi:hypothetical protein